MKSSFLEIKIYYEDTDAGGVVYYANYLKYFERARTEYMRENGINVAELASKGTQFVVAQAAVEYRSSAVLGDLLAVETRVSEIGKVSFWFEYEIKRKSDGKLLVTGRTKLACVDSTGRVIRLPSFIKEISTKN
ncbi:MAG: Acyl-CoA thioester hydrolase YbgC [Elusimicrobia bacterium ADurb.Bin231]|nr:MAG: Acyl-CoA thioester hydrolase YbgC [Elusimicrobia bacterium ADurb.Bin231]